MKIADSDATLYIIPSYHFPEDYVYLTTWHRYTLSYLSDDFPVNYTYLRSTPFSNYIEIRTSNSEYVGVSGTNSTYGQVWIVDGTIHDSMDLVSNGLFANWNSDGTPEDWTVEANCIATEGGGSEIWDLGEYSYTNYCQLDDPDTDTDVAITQTITVSANTDYVLSIIYKSIDIGNNIDGLYSIYDEDNEAYIANGNIYNPTPEGYTNDLSAMHYIFATPLGCTSITISIWCRNVTSNYIQIFGVCLKEVTESKDSITLSNEKLFSSENFNTFVQEYTKITGNHSVFVKLTSSSQIKIGGIQTGLLNVLNDPRETMQQGLEIKSPYIDLRYGGRLQNNKYNISIFDCELVLNNDEAIEFMMEIYPTIIRQPRFIVLGNLDEQYWSIFARFDDSPIMTDENLFKRLSFKLVESI